MALVVTYIVSMKLSTTVVPAVSPVSAPDLANDLAGARKPDVIFIHGTGSNSEMWAPQVEALSNLGHRCCLMDLRGHGKTPEPGENTTIEVHIKDVLDTLAACDLQYPAIFVGHSLGAIISLELGQRRPEMFEQVFAVGMPGRVLSVVVFLFRIVLLFPYEKLRGTTLQKNLPWRLRTLLNTQRFTLMQIVANFQSLDYVSEPFKVKCPVHFSAGRFDPVAPYPYVKQMHRKLPQSTLRVFEFAGHNHMDQYPRQFNQWLSSSLVK